MRKGGVRPGKPGFSRLPWTNPRGSICSHGILAEFAENRDRHQPVRGVSPETPGARMRRMMELRDHSSIIFLIATLVVYIAFISARLEARRSPSRVHFRLCEPVRQVAIKMAFLERGTMGPGYGMWRRVVSAPSACPEGKGSIGPASPTESTRRSKPRGSSAGHGRRARMSGGPDSANAAHRLEMVSEALARIPGLPGARCERVRLAVGQYG